MIEQTFGVRLLKEHSAADWSTRPLPTDWLRYAALDVELLVELRDALAAELDAQGKRAWAEQEFAALVAGAGVPARRRTDPWRRTSGIHRVRTRRGLGLVESLWNARDAIARRLDRAPGRILPDAAISEVAESATPGRDALRRVPAFSRRQAKRFEADWLAAIGAVEQLPEHRAPDPAPGRRRPAADPRLGVEEPGGRHPAGPGPRGPDRPRRGAEAARREPAHPRARPPPDLDAAGRADPRVRRRRPGRVRRPPVAARPDRRRADRRARRA